MAVMSAQLPLYRVQSADSAVDTISAPAWSSRTHQRIFSEPSPRRPKARQVSRQGNSLRLGDRASRPESVLELLDVVGWFHSTRSSTPAQITAFEDKILASHEKVSPQSSLRPPPSGQVLETFTFRGKEHLVRASPLSCVLGRWGEVFDMMPSREAFALSQEVQRIDCFVSYNWSISRFRKHLCLSFHFNLFWALWAAAFATVAVFVAQTNELFSREVVWQIHIPTPIFLLVLFCKDAGFLVRGCRGPMLFLDKTCVNQVDADQQRESIEKIGAFVARSSTMVVIYTQEYLQKLWTVYEIACFLALHNVDRVKIVPADLPVVALTTIVMLYLFQVVFVTTQNTDVYQIAEMWSVPYVAMHFVLALVYRGHARIRTGLFDALSSFDVHGCRVFCDSDRPMIYRNISVLMRAVRLVPEGTEDEPALSAFNKLIRDELPDVLALSSGLVGLRYAYAVTFSLLLIGPFFLVLGVVEEMEVMFEHRFWLMQGLTFTMLFAVFPFSLQFLVFWVGDMIELQGGAELVYLIWGIMITIAIDMVCSVLLFLAVLQPGKSQEELGDPWMLVGCSLVMTLGAICAFRKFRDPHEHRREIRRQRGERTPLPPPELSNPELLFSSSAS